MNIHVCIYIYLYMYIYLIYIYNYSHMNMGVSRRKMLNPLRSFWTNTHSSNSRKTSGYSFPSPNLETGIPSYPWFAWQIETSQDEFEHGNPQKRKVNSNFLIRTLELVEFLSLCMISFGISLIFGSRTNHLQGFAQMFVVFLSWPLREKNIWKKNTLTHSIHVYLPTCTHKKSTHSCIGKYTRPSHGNPSWVIAVIARSFRSLWATSSVGKLV